MSVEDDDAADRAFEARARAELRRGIDETPPELRAKLDRIVDRAVSQPRRRNVIRFAAPAGAGAIAIIAGLLVVQPWRSTVAPPAAAADDFALLIDGDNLDLLEQMEFYQWLDRQPGALDVAPAAPGSAQRS
jgi:hypothetical protein